VTVALVLAWRNAELESELDALKRERLVAAVPVPGLDRPLPAPAVVDNPPVECQTATASARPEAMQPATVPRGVSNAGDEDATHAEPRERPGEATALWNAIKASEEEAKRSRVYRETGARNPFGP
jgi:hypothetical protein